jgi:hypothetical protein
MKWLSVLVLMSIMIVASNVPGGHLVARAATPQYGKVVSLESLTTSDVDGFTVISPSQPASYHGRPITHGIQIPGSDSGEAHVRYQLGLRYVQLFGAIYGDDKNTATGSYFDVYDTSHTVDLSQARLLYRYEFKEADGSAKFNIDVRGVNFITLRPEGGSMWDLVAYLSTGTLAPTQVKPLYPIRNTGVPAGSRVLFGWQPFPGAANYIFHIWLVKSSGNQPFTPATPASLSVTIHGKTTYTWDDHGFLPGIYQYDLLPLDSKGTSLAAWSNLQQITLVD